MTDEMLDLIARLRDMAPESGSTIACRDRTTREMNSDIRAAANRLSSLEEENARLKAWADGPDGVKWHVERTKALSDQVRGLEEEKRVLDWFGTQTSLELHHYRPMFGDDDDQAIEWRVTRVSGGYNDREWTVVGQGQTPLEAMKSARTALSAGVGR